MQDKELIWVTKEQAEIFKDLDSDENKRNFVDKLIRERKQDIEASIESLDDDLLRLKAFALNYKVELKKAYQEQVDVFEKLWDESEDKIGELKEKIRQLITELQKATSQINSVKNSLDSISTYHIDKLIDVVHKVNNMSEEDRNLMVNLINMTKHE